MTDASQRNQQVRDVDAPSATYENRETTAPRHTSPRATQVYRQAHETFQETVTVLSTIHPFPERLSSQRRGGLP